MKAVLHYLGVLFVRTDAPPARAQVRTALVLLWFVQLFGINQAALAGLPAFALGRSAGAVALAAYTVWVQLTAVALYWSVPWGFLLFAGSVGLARRLAPTRHWTVQTMFGAAVFLLFRATIIAPAQYLGYTQALMPAVEVAAIVAPALDALAIGLLCAAVAGLVFLVVTIRGLAQHNSAANAATRPRKLSRDAFAARYWLMSVVALVLTGTLLGIEQAGNYLDLRYSLAVLVAIVIAGIVAIVMTFRRIRDIGASPWVLCYPLLGSLVAVGSGLALSTIATIALVELAALALHAGALVPQLFVLWLCTAPSKGAHIDD